MTIKEIIAKVNQWHSYAQVRFLEKIPHLITIAIRDILENKETAQRVKLDAIKWINEFQQRALVNIYTLKNGELNQDFERLQKDIILYAAKNEIARNSIYWSVGKAYERTINQVENPTVRAKEQYIIMNALNEITGGAYAIDDEEFHTLIGAEKSEVIQLWKDLNNLWVNKYVILQEKDKNSISHSLIKWGQPIDENDEEILFVFEAKNYTRASEVFRRFLGFEPYEPMPDDIIVKRIFDLKDRKGNKIKDVILSIYKPVKNNENEWSCSYQITEIQDNALYSILGIDSLQSIQLALYVIDGLLKNYNKEHENQIFWQDSCEDFGLDIKFPMR